MLELRWRKFRFSAFVELTRKCSEPRRLRFNNSSELLHTDPQTKTKMLRVLLDTKLQFSMNCGTSVEIKNENIERGEKIQFWVFGFSGSANERKIIELFISCECSPFANCARDFHLFAFQLLLVICDLCWSLVLSRVSFMPATSQQCVDVCNNT